MSVATATFNVRIARKRVEAEGICSLELVPLDAVPLPLFSAGSHIDVHLAAGMTRQYSLCNAAGIDDRYQICVLRDPNSRGGSAAVHNRLAEGDCIEISAPKNHFPLAHGASSSLLIAGGIGITPIICMAERLHVAGSKFELHYCARSGEAAAFIDRIRASPYASHVTFHFSDAGGRVHPNALFDAAAQSADVYVCGPSGFIAAVIDAARARGWPEQRLHQEHFASEVVLNEADLAFQVKLASSGQLVRVAPAETVLAALAKAGVEVPYSCEQGVCGTCLTRVLEGTPDHRDAFLTPAEQAANDEFLPCCSRSKSPLLVLDL